MARKELDWTRTGTLQAMGEWVRGEIGALVLVAVRPSDAVLLTAPGLALLDMQEAARRCVPQLTAAITMERRKGSRVNHAGVMHPRIEWLRSNSDAICVLGIRQRDSVLLLDARCRPEDAGQLLLEYLPELAAHYGESTKYKGARLVFEPCQA
jgi:hypothetical protein